MCVCVCVCLLSCGHCNLNRNKRTAVLRLRWPVSAWPTAESKRNQYILPNDFLKSAWINSNSVQEAYITWCGRLGKKTTLLFLSQKQENIWCFSPFLKDFCLWVWHFRRPIDVFYIHLALSHRAQWSASTLRESIRDVKSCELDLPLQTSALKRTQGNMQSNQFTFWGSPD